MHLERTANIGAGDPSANPSFKQGGGRERGFWDWNKSFPRYSRSETTLVSFEMFLQNIDGNQRSANVAQEIATDVSKFL